MAKSSANVMVVNLSDGRSVCLSYGVIVAAFIPRTYGDKILGTSPLGALSGYVRTSERFSVTTSRHANQFAGKDSPEIAHAELLALCAPVESK